jgi:hypothetical protein
VGVLTNMMTLQLRLSEKRPKDKSNPTPSTQILSKEIQKNAQISNKHLDTLLICPNKDESIEFTLPGYNSRYSNSLRAGRSRDRILVEVRFSTPVQNGPGAHPAFRKMGAGSLSRG